MNNYNSKVNLPTSNSWIFTESGTWCKPSWGSSAAPRSGTPPRGSGAPPRCRSAWSGSPATCYRAGPAAAGQVCEQARGRKRPSDDVRVTFDGQLRHSSIWPSCVLIDWRALTGFLLKVPPDIICLKSPPLTDLFVWNPVKVRHWQTLTFTVPNLVFCFWWSLCQKSKCP